MAHGWCAACRERCVAISPCARAASVDGAEHEANPRLFRHYDAAYHQGQGHDVDRFATANNALVPRFNSRYDDPQTEAVDAFAQDWSEDINWINPPWGCLPQVVAKLEQTPGVRATVVAPCWPGAPWFKPLTRLSRRIDVLPPSQDMFLTGTLGSRAIVGRPNWSAVVCEIVGSSGPAVVRTA